MESTVSIPRSDWRYWRRSSIDTSITRSRLFNTVFYFLYNLFRKFPSDIEEDMPLIHRFVVRHIQVKSVGQQHTFIDNSNQQNRILQRIIKFFQNEKRNSSAFIEINKRIFLSMKRRSIFSEFFEVDNSCRIIAPSFN